MGVGIRNVESLRGEPVKELVNDSFCPGADWLLFLLEELRAEVDCAEDDVIRGILEAAVVVFYVAGMGPTVLFLSTLHLEVELLSQEPVIPHFVNGLMNELKAKARVF